MKFFHVYNDWAVDGLMKNGLINEESGFKMQHVFSVPLDMQFNEYAKKGGRLYDFMKNGRYPFYVDRIAGGITFYKYAYDKALINTLKEDFGDRFMGFQLHECSSNFVGNVTRVLTKMGKKPPYDYDEFMAKNMSSYAITPDGRLLPALSQETPEYYCSLEKFSENYDEYLDEIEALFRRRMDEVCGCILPCDSYHLATKIYDELGLPSFMPEVGSQIAHMRIEVALNRGMAKASGKTWGTYYECWRNTPGEGGKSFPSMPCFNLDPSNEWYLTQQLHPDDFTSYGENGGSSRLLQNRIYYYSLMAGADYMSEEWGLNCSYTDMKEFTLSEYGQVKKDFINTTLTMKGMKAIVPFAVVMPQKNRIIQLGSSHKIGEYRSQYLGQPLDSADIKWFGHVEDVLKLLLARHGEPIGNEGHVITNSRFGDLFDIIYDDASDEALSRYEYLIDASPEGAFAAKKSGKYNILTSSDLDALANELERLIPEVMPCYADGLCWLVSYDENGKRYFTILNNEGNERSLTDGNTLDRTADRTVRVTFKEDTPNLTMHRTSKLPASIEREDDRNYLVTVPAAGYAVMTY